MIVNTHIIVDFYKAESEILARADKLQAAVSSAFAELKIEISQDSYIQFEPYGVSANVVGPSVYFSIHTWPEHGSCAIDLYCSQDSNFARQIANALQAGFKAKEYDIKILDRSKNQK